MATISEEFFEKFCRDQGINCERIEEDGETSPDYLLRIQDHIIIAEVKEIEKNKEERESYKLLKERGRGKVLTNEPGDRVRSKIRKASPQIKARTEGKYSGILVLFDGGNSFRHLDPYNIRVAMLGLEQIHINIPNNLNQSPYSTGISHGPKRKMTENANTSISAIAAMYCDREGTTSINIFHNPYAAIPLNLEFLNFPRITQFLLNTESCSSASGWVKYEP